MDRDRLAEPVGKGTVLVFNILSARCELLLCISFGYCKYRSSLVGLVQSVVYAQYCFNAVIKSRIRVDLLPIMTVAYLEGGLGENNLNVYKQI